MLSGMWHGEGVVGLTPRGLMGKAAPRLPTPTSELGSEAGFQA